MTCQECRPEIVRLIKIMPVRGIGIRDISVVPGISITKVLRDLKPGEYMIKPKQSHYDCLEIDGFWTYVRKEEQEQSPAHFIPERPEKRVPSL
jgi:hypothetical protein